MDMSLISRIMITIRFSSVALGLIGNVISFVVFSRPVFRKNSISTYCRALAVFDCFEISELVITFGLVFYNRFYPQDSDWACKAYYYIGLAFAAIPGWILIVFSIDKVLSMKRIGSNILKKKLFQYGIIVTIVLINLFLYIGVAIYLQRVTIYFYGMPYILCDLSTLSFSVYVSTMFLIEGSVLPFLIMFGSSIVSIKMIRDSTKNIERRAGPNVRNVSNRSNRDFKFAISSVAFNISFIVLKLPLTIMVVLGSFIPSLATDYDVLAVFATLYYIHYSSSFFIHLASNSIFRRELMVVLRLYRPVGVESWQQSTAGINRRTNIGSVTNKIESLND